MSASAGKKGGLSREQAAAMYEDLRKNFAAFSGGVDPKIKSAQLAAAGKKSASIKPNANQQQIYKKANRVEPVNSPEEQMLAMMLAQQAQKKEGKFGTKMAVTFVLLVAGLKLTLGAMEYSGVLKVENAQASIVSFSQSATNDNFSGEQIALLKALDTRRAELEERRRALDKRDEEFNNRDREFAIKLAELRELTQTLKGNRELENKKKTTQLDQFSNVYGSMDPKEAALLIEQLDDTIAIELLNRMPEKRIGQILSLMNKDKALVITKMLSGRASS